MEQISKVQVYGIILLIIGVAIRYFINRRRFNRTNEAAVQIFKSFEHKTFIRPLESIFKLIAMALILFGFLLIAIECYNRKDLDKHQQQNSSAPSNRK
jgi:uncharacterized membrane protein